MLLHGRDGQQRPAAQRHGLYGPEGLTLPFSSSNSFHFKGHVLPHGRDGQQRPSAQRHGQHGPVGLNLPFSSSNSFHLKNDVLSHGRDGQQSPAPVTNSGDACLCPSDVRLCGLVSGPQKFNDTHLTNKARKTQKTQLK